MNIFRALAAATLIFSTVACSSESMEVELAEAMPVTSSPEELESAMMGIQMNCFESMDLLIGSYGAPEERETSITETSAEITFWYWTRNTAKVFTWDESAPTECAVSSFDYEL